jgi:hypothetical protein
MYWILKLPAYYIVDVVADSKGSPRSVTNSKGRKRRPGARTLAAAVRADDPAFLHFLHRCLE